MSAEQKASRVAMEALADELGASPRPQPLGVSARSGGFIRRLPAGVERLCRRHAVVLNRGASPTSGIEIDRLTSENDRLSDMAKQQAETVRCRRRRRRPPSPPPLCQAARHRPSCNRGAPSEICSDSSVDALVGDGGRADRPATRRGGHRR